MKIRLRLQAVLLAAIVLIAGSAYGQHFYQMQAHTALIEVLTQEVFEARFGDNPHIPRSEGAIIALAKKLYPSLESKEETMAPAEEITEDCGEEGVGVLFAALKNPAVSDTTRKMVSDIIVAAIPPLPKVKYSPSGHFKISYTSNDADPLHNVTDAQINSLAILLDSYWNLYAASFKEPQYKLVGGKKRIDVMVYYISETIRGRTHSDWSHIELNSAKCVRDSCKRRTTSAHELFHRVQYAYGYASETPNLKWLVEGTAAWSQKFTNQSLRDYMARMNSGLSSPNKALITERSYDACHFWTYLQEQAGSSSAIKNVWAEYQANGLKAKEAVGSVTTARLGLNFDEFAAKWSKANYIKDLSNAITGGYSYDENAVTKTSCGDVYGPLSKVPVTAGGTINPDSFFSKAGYVTPYGAKYHVFTLGATLKNLAVTFKRESKAGSFEVAFIGIKNNEWKNITDTAAPTYDYKKTLNAGQWDKLAVMVMGMATGGTYSLKVGSCIAGTWTDGWGKTWVLKENGASITGTYEASGCGIYNVTGTYNTPDITLTAKQDVVTAGCCSVRYEGTVTDCNSIQGTATQIGPSTTCTRTGSFRMTKQTSTSPESSALIESGEDPSCGMCDNK